MKSSTPLDSLRTFVVFLCLLALLPAMRSAAEEPLPWQFARLKSFGDPDRSAASPGATVIFGADGVLYGTSAEGGAADVGTIFRVQPNGSGFKVLHSFGGSPDDGARPGARLLQASDGLLYGTTDDGGGQRSGMIFRLNPDGTGYEVLHHFDVEDSAYGAGRVSELIEGSDGRLYGTAGNYLRGRVYRMNKDGSGFEALYDLGAPGSGLLEASDGALYGTAGLTIFKLNKDGTGYELLHTFEQFSATPVSPSALIEGRDEFLYGTTQRGGIGAGTIFKLRKNGTRFQVLYTFESTGASGLFASGPLSRGENGLLYGVTSQGGPSDSGTLFAVNERGSLFRVLNHFGQGPAGGSRPMDRLMQARDGALYGVTLSGGRAGFGTLFRFTAMRGLATVWNFTKGGGDAWRPNSLLASGTNGMFYGTTERGGIFEWGAIYQISANGDNYRLLWNFTRIPLGVIPNGVVLDPDSGTLYGTTAGGGVNGGGVLFRLTRNRRYKVLHDFSPEDGMTLTTPLVIGSDGFLYGTTGYGGSYGGGTVFQIRKDGSDYRILHHFFRAGFFAEWATGVAEGSDDGLYVAWNETSIFLPSMSTLSKVNKDGSGFTNILRITSAVSHGAPMRGSDGMFYGAIEKQASGNPFPGPDVGHDVFRVNPDGSGYQILHVFGIGDQQNVLCPLVEGADGTLYGATQSSGDPNGAGSVFRMRRDGSAFEKIWQFTHSDGVSGATPLAGVLATPDGAVYGTTGAGGDINQGTVFKLSPPPGVITPLNAGGY